MSIKKPARWTALLLLLALPIIGTAHHSHGNYSLHNYTNLTGTVEKVIWINPHAWIHLSVDNDNGESELWALEGGGLAALARRGWEKEDIEAGDTISVRCHQLRDGANGCLLGYVTPEGGVEKEWD
ncbi:MAG: hypothetical protein HOM55_08680 [Proteobacteria bacterium]|jgi:hypothetical protein|nr:hypothetical protein [Pseudomonadota bacterium]